MSGAPDYSINFWADNTNPTVGSARLRWDVRNVQAVYLDGEGVAGVSDREVCPAAPRPTRCRPNTTGAGSAR
ncbi:MAG: hypothetical protein IPK16_30415 [Anaerolineales bacterium]|nr:hypothetical protein [Anaerolineales bacterium]